MSHRQHGTRAKYVIDRCRCFPCKVANSHYAQWLAKQVAYGIPRRVDADTAREYILVLRELGVGDRRIAELAGLERKTVRDIRICDTRKILPGTENAILTVHKDPEVTAADSAMIDAAKTWRRIHALEALGYAKSWIAREAGLGSSIQLRTDKVLARNARKVKALAERVGDTPGPNDRARHRAARLGYKVPAYFDENFDLDTDPGGLSVSAELRAERRDEVARLRRTGLTGQQIAWTLGINIKMVERDLQYAEQQEAS